MKRQLLAIALSCIIATACDPTSLEKDMAYLYMENHTDFLNIYVEISGLNKPYNNLDLHPYLTQEEIDHNTQKGEPDLNRIILIYGTPCTKEYKPKDFINSILKDNPEAMIFVYKCLGNKDSPKKGELICKWNLNDINIMPYTRIGYQQAKEYFFTWDE